jgi:uncharacterized protein YhjY with autotransporter beta-barrel domain
VVKVFRSCWPYLLIMPALLAEAAVAQNVRQFETYGQAIDTILGAGTAFRCELVPYVFDNNGKLNPDLTVLDRENDIERQIPNQVGPISQNLSRHCIRRTNIFGGSVVSGSLSSIQPTRTVSQFDPARDRTKTNAESPSPKENLFENLKTDMFGEINGAAFEALYTAQDIAGANLKLSGDGFTVFGSVSHDYLKRSETQFESAAEFKSLAGEVGFVSSVNDSFLFGAKAKFRHSDDKYTGPKTIDSKDQAGNTIDLQKWWAFNNFSPLVDYEDACGVSRNGKASSDELGVSVFGAARLLGTGFISAEIGGGRVVQQYQRSLCLLTISGSPIDPNTTLANQVSQGANPTEIFSGRISGNPSGYQFNARLRSGKDYDIDGWTIGPRIGVDLAHTRLGSYGETEIGGNPSTVFSPEDGQFPTGTSLRYDDQNVTSLQSRLGLTVSHTIIEDSVVITPFVEFNYIHEFANNQRNITVSFVEDGRAQPVRFSFKNNAPDRDYFELGGGIVTGLTSSINLFARGNVILGNKHYDGFGLQAGLSASF